jgi:hypothetical protein
VLWTNVILAGRLMYYANTWFRQYRAVHSPHVSAVLTEIGVALLVAFVAGAVFLLGQLMYAQLVLMPRVVASGSAVLAVSVDIKWTVAVAALAFAAYLARRMWRRNGPG